MEWLMKKIITYIVSWIIFVPVLSAGELPMTFDELDENQDGYITKSEVSEQAELSKSWSKVDKDSDKKIDITEYSAYQGKERFIPPEDMEEPEIGAAPFNPIAEAN